MATRRMRSGQAMVETAIAVLLVASLFVCLFKVAHLLTGKILLEHAAMRVARARTIGMNDYMCLKAARIAALPVCGRRLWPFGEDFTYEMERGRFGNYLLAYDDAIARGILEYEGWNRLSVDPDRGSQGVQSRASLDIHIFEEPTYEVGVDGNAGLESHCGLYLNGGIP